MITNLEKNFAAIEAKQFVEEFKKKNTKKEKSVYYNPKQKIWIMAEKKDNKTESFIKKYEEDLTKPITKYDNKYNKENTTNVRNLFMLGYSYKEISQKLDIPLKNIYAIVYNNKMKR